MALGSDPSSELAHREKGLDERARRPDQEPKVSSPRRAVRPSNTAPARRSYYTHSAKGYHAGAAPEFGPSQL